MNECNMLEQERSALKSEAVRISLDWKETDLASIVNDIYYRKRCSEEMNSLMRRSIQMLYKDARINI